MAVTITISILYMKKLRLEEVMQIVLGTRKCLSWGSIPREADSRACDLNCYTKLTRKLSEGLEERQVFPTGWLWEDLLEEEVFSERLARNLNMQRGERAFQVKVIVEAKNRE